MNAVCHSVAMTGEVNRALSNHLLRDDGQEDICLATYRVSTGAKRRTALINEVLLPRSGEREVHRTASFTGDYVVRAAIAASLDGSGIAILHSHPSASGWQFMSSYDEDAERSHTYIAHEITGLPLLGLTLAGADHAWCARSWSPDGVPSWCESVRALSDQLSVSWNDEIRPPPVLQATQIRTASAWGDALQADIARLRVLVVGVGSVGLEVGLRLAASGIERVGVMDFDSVERVNLDRLIGADVLDAVLHRSKTDVARRLLRNSATARRARITIHDVSICEPTGLAAALDYDVIFSCVDRPWPRAVLNMSAYADLIPVIDGGIHIDAFPDGGMRNATWRSHVLRPGRPCLACNKQLDLGSVSLDREGLLADIGYIAGADLAARPGRQNVAALAVSVAASLLAQFVSLVAAPGGMGEPGPLQYVLSTHSLEHLPQTRRRECVFEVSVAAGDSRIPLTGSHAHADAVRDAQLAARRRLRVRMIQRADDVVSLLRRLLGDLASRHLR